MRLKPTNLTVRESSSAVLELFDDMDELLASDEHFLLGKWLYEAANLARTPLVSLTIECFNVNRYLKIEK